MKLPTGLRAYTRTRPIVDSEFDSVRAWWNNRVENDYAWKVSIEDIRARNFNLDCKNPKKKEEEAVMSSEDLIKGILKKEIEIQAMLVSLQ